MSVFNLNDQNSNLDNKIVAGLDRISQVFKTLLWEKSKTFNLSPIQIQLLIFIAYHSEEKTTISYLSQEFNLSKPTISDTIKTLEQKLLIEKMVDVKDTRSYRIKLTESGKNIVLETENFVNPLEEIIGNSTHNEKLVLWQNITNIIQQLNQLKIISIQRNCFNCKHYSVQDDVSFCNLLNRNLETEDIRIDCGEFEKI
ncbi:MAG: MarR family winged helix-turn-helix transcriptional regulator [Flavobacterium sp.]|uniref:MarR family winged helix-turn-helix transcriptional regulator n=1 Tax=Flavobacterium sp. TaxID=239 RepID=UPI0025BE720C|nr:MarR family winged helix-turn-helix transcriptional regulator [Flavobacterium sp.]MCK6608135.1 MarR family winged helix-turn-helix transcriptional regulator [Flavobacterium sp.]